MYNAVVLNKSLYVCQCTHNLSDGYVGLVAVGVREQAEDILVPPQLTATKLFDFNDISFRSHYLPSRTVVLAIDVKTFK